MAMPDSNNPISMDQMRTEWGLSGPISMSAMYRDGANVQDTASMTCSVSATNVPCGVGYGNGARNNHRDVANPCGAGNTPGYNYGYWRGGVTPSTSISFGQAQDSYVFFYNASWWAMSASPTSVFDITFPTPLTYYWSGYTYDSGGIVKIGTTADPGSIYSDTSVGCGSGCQENYSGNFTTTSVNQVIRVTYKMPTSGSPLVMNIYSSFGIGVDSAGSGRTLTSLNQTVPTSGPIDFQDFYSTRKY